MSAEMPTLSFMLEAYHQISCTWGPSCPIVTWREDCQNCWEKKKEESAVIENKPH